MIALPIDVVIPDLLAALAGGVAVLEAPPGSGKTTRVPPALAGVVEGQVWVLEPRRIAARASAARVASERGERVGETVGYAVRHDRKEGPATRVMYVTEALLARKIAADPWLRGIGAVVLDEFHERSIHTDLALALVAALRGERPDLRLLVMSATFDARAVADWLGAPRVNGGSRPFPVEIEHLARPDERPIHELAAAGVRAEVARLGGRPAGILVFLPGVGEITRTQEALAGLDADVVPLHGELDASAQDRALRPGGARPRVILATNVAETSLTVPDVVTVVDCGLARIAGHDPWSGLGTLDLEPISRASADQRAGRAGRTGPGRCLRLYTKASFDARPAETLPEIRRVDLAGVLLDLATRRRRPGEPVEPRWFEPPAPAAWAAARAQLERLGAIDRDELPTAVGTAMAGLPLSPRLARSLVEAAALGAPREGAALVARLDQGGRGRRGIEDPVTEALHGRLADGAAQVRQQLVGMLGASGRSSTTSPEEALSRALFAGFPDRVGRRRAAAGNAYGAVVFAEGGSAELDAPVPGRGDEVVVVAGVERIAGRAKVRAMTPIPEDWLLDAAEVRTQVSWVGSRVEVREQLVYGSLILDDGPGTGDPDVVGALLAEHALPVAHRVFPDAEKAEALVQRAAFLRRVGALSGEAFTFEDLVRAGCRGRRSFDDLGHVSLCDLAPVDRALVDRLAPDSTPLGNRARAPITWPADGDPYLSSRMQDFFGLARSPTVANGRPLVLHLLAPSGSPVQVTTDLAGFWERHYPAIRKELCRKYPRHYWPEDPLQAEPIQHVRGGVPFKR